LLIAWKVKLGVSWTKFERFLKNIRTSEADGGCTYGTRHFGAWPTPEGGVFDLQRTTQLVEELVEQLVESGFN